MRTGIYVRVSTKDQTEGYSLDDQLRRCREYADMQGWTVVCEYVDAGHSAYRKPEQRPQFQAMIADAHAKKIQAVVTFKFDRFARQTLQQLQSASDLERLGIVLHSATEPSKRNSAADKFLFTMMAAVAQFESDKTSERVQGACSEAARQGIWVGPVPIGYARGSDRILQPSEDAVAVALAYELYAQGEHSLNTLAAELNTRGYSILNVQTRKRSRFTRYNVVEILHNPVYKGMVRYQHDIFPGQHEPLVSEELWDAVQSELMHNRRVSSNGTITRQRLEKQEGLLTNLAYCYCCGAKAWYPGRGSRSFAYYKCSNRESKSRDTTCTMLPMIRADVVEQQMDDVLRLLVLPQDWHEEILTSAEAIVYAERRTHTPERISEDTLRDKLQRILEQYEDGFISREVYREKATDIQRQIHHLHTATESANKAVDLRQFVHLLHDMGTLLESSDAETKRALIQHLFSHVYLHREAGRGRDKHSVRALTPTEVALPLIAAIYHKVHSVSQVTPRPPPARSR